MLFGAGAYVAYRLFDHVQTRVAIWLDPFADAAGRGLPARAVAVRARRRRHDRAPGLGQGLPTRIPFVETDFIFSAIGEELGLLGAAAVIIVLPGVLRARPRDRGARALATWRRSRRPGSSPRSALQAFVIIGGVTRLIPLTGVTLPFVSYGGSSLLSTFILLALLLRAGDEGTGLETEMQVTSTDLGVLGRFALGRRLTRGRDRARRCCSRRSS